MDNPNNKKSNEEKSKIIILAFVIALAGIFMPRIISIFYGTSDPKELSPIGDWIGGTAAPLLSFAGFLMIYAAFSIQKEELKSQKEEFIQQNRTLAMQRFENTFFNLIGLHNDITRSFEHENVYGDKFKGRDCLRAYYFKLKGDYEEEISSKGVRDKKEECSKVFNKMYEKLFEDEQDTLGHYFRNLYHIYKFIKDTKGIENNDKHRYAGILRAQLSTYELVLLMFNVSSKYGEERFYPLVKEYDVLQNMNPKFLLTADQQETFNDLTNSNC